MEQAVSERFKAWFITLAKETEEGEVYEQGDRTNCLMQDTRLKKQKYRITNDNNISSRRYQRPPLLFSLYLKKVQNYSVQIQHTKPRSLYNMTNAYGSLTRSRKLYSTCTTSVKVPQQEQFYVSLSDSNVKTCTSWTVRGASPFKPRAGHGYPVSSQDSNKLHK